MNTSGLDNEELLLKCLQKHNYNFNKNNLESIINQIIEEYYFSEYYENLKIYGKIKTPESLIISLKNVFENKNIVNENIKTFPNNEVFARLDTASTKPTFPYKNINDILNDMAQNERTRKHLKDMNHNLVLREWINLQNYYELRCFIEDSKLRATSGTTNLNHVPPINIKKILQKIAEDVSFYCEYECFTLDIAIPLFNELNENKYYIIEINTPVWLCATSGLYDLTIPYDIYLLTEEYNTEIINYPKMRILFNDSVIEI